MNVFEQRNLSSLLADGIFYAILAETFFIALSPGAATVALLAGIVLWIARMKIDKGARTFRRLPFDVPVALFTLLGGLSILQSPDPAFSFYNYCNRAGMYVLTYLLVGQNVVGDDDQVWKLAIVMGAAALLVVLYGFYQAMLGADTSAMRWVDGAAFPELKKRAFSTWENPNILAGYLDVMICLAFSFFLKLRETRLRVILGIGLAMLVACLAMTYARGACIAIVIVIAGYGILRDWRILAVCAAVVCAALALDATLLERIRSVLTLGDTSSTMRLALWDSTLAMIQDHPFLGIGWGAYWMVYPEYDYFLQGAPVRIVHAHNLYLNYAAEIGIAGAIAFLWCMFGTALMALRAKIPESSEVLSATMLGIGLAVVSIALNGLTDDLLFNFPSSLLLWLLCALAAAVEHGMDMEG